MHLSTTSNNPSPQSKNPVKPCALNYATLLSNRAASESNFEREDRAAECSELAFFSFSVTTASLTDAEALRCCVATVAESVDPAVSVDFCTLHKEESALALTLAGLIASCRRIKEVLVEKGVALRHEVRFLSVPIKAWNAKKGEIHPEEQSVSSTEPLISLSDGVAEGAFCRIEARSTAAKLLANRLFGLFFSDLPQGKVPLGCAENLALLAGPENRLLLSVMVRFGVAIDVETPRVAYIPFQSLPLELVVYGRSQDSVSAACSFLSLMISSSQQKVSVVTERIPKLLASLVLSNDRSKLESIAVSCGAIMKVLSNQTTVELYCYASNQSTAKSALAQVLSVIYEYEECVISFISNERESLRRDIPLISQKSDCVITQSNDQVTILGKEKNISDALSLLEKRHQSILSICYKISQDCEIREFICGKKDGKILRIQKECAVAVELQNLSEPSTGVQILVSSRFFRALVDGVAFLRGEFPAELTFFVPDEHHKRIIGHGGKNIQRIMKKHSAYIKFLSPSECTERYGYLFEYKEYSMLPYQPNVIVRTPRKNQSVLRQMREEVLAEAGEKSLAIEKAQIFLPLGCESFLEIDFCKKISKLVDCDIFLPLNNILEIRTLSTLAADRISSISSIAPRDFVVEAKGPDEHSVVRSSFSEAPEGALELKCSFGRLATQNQKKSPPSSALPIIDFSSFESVLFTSINAIDQNLFFKSIPSVVSIDRNLSENDSSFFPFSLSLENILGNPCIQARQGSLKKPSQSGDILRFLTLIGLDCYFDDFLKHNVDFQALFSITDENLKDIGVSSPGCRHKLLETINQLKGSDPLLSPMTAFSNNFSLLSADQKLAEEILCT